MKGETELIKELQQRSINLGKKGALDILAKAFNNSCIDDHISVMLQSFKSN